MEWFPVSGRKRETVNRETSLFDGGPCSLPKDRNNGSIIQHVALVISDYSNSLLYHPDTNLGGDSERSGTRRYHISME